METRWQKRWRIESIHRYNLDETDVHRQLNQMRRTRLTSFTSTSILGSFCRGTCIGHSPTFLRPSVSSDLFHHEIVGQRKWSRNKHPVHQYTHLVDEWNDAVDFVAEETQDREATGKEITQDSHWIAKQQNVGMSCWETTVLPISYLQGWEHEIDRFEYVDRYSGPVLRHRSLKPNRIDDHQPDVQDEKLQT